MFVNTFLVSTLLLFYIYSSVLVIVFEQRSYGIVFHIAVTAYLKGLQVVREVVIDDVYSGLEIDEVVVGVWPTILYGLPFWNACCLSTLDLSFCIL